MTNIELPDGQRQILQAQPGKPIDVVDAGSQQRYVLLAREQYERVRLLLEPAPPEKPQGVPLGILRWQHAFWRDLPELLTNKKNHGKWVCYHGEERIGIAEKSVDLIRECLRRELKDDEYDLDVIEPHALPPWQAEDIACGGAARQPTRS